MFSTLFSGQGLTDSTYTRQQSSRLIRHFQFLASNSECSASGAGIARQTVEAKVARKDAERREEKRRNALRLKPVSKLVTETDATRVLQTGTFRWRKLVRRKKRRLAVYTYRQDISSGINFRETQKQPMN